MGAAPAASDPRVQALHRILSAEMPLPQLEDLLSTSGIAPVPELVDAVLRLSYSTPAEALRFFRWAGASARHTAGTWDLMIDILGKNSLFEAMWDAIHSMKREFGALQLPTFVSVFSSYCAAGQFKDAVMSFEVMERYGVVADVVALNALLTAFCSQRGRTGDAAGYLEKIKGKIAPNGETFAILLEGWRKEGNAAAALRTFGEMVMLVGWRSEDVAAHNVLLVTLISAGQIEETVQFLKLMKSNKCASGAGLEVFRSALDVLAKEKNYFKASQLWDIMALEPSPVPDLHMYRTMIVLCCETRNISLAYKLLDEMPFNGVFPDSAIYGAILDCHVRMNDAQEAEKFFAEMRKNEHVPSASICAAAIRMFFKEFNPVAAQDVWRCVVEERVSPADGCAQEVVKGFLDLRRPTEVNCYLLEEILGMGIELPSNITDRLKSAPLNKTVTDDCYDHIAKRQRPMH